jgi:hypothetical protein
MNKGQKRKILQNKRIKYNEMDQSKKEELKEKQVEKKSQIHDIDIYIEKFKKQIKAGPFYICCVCNRTLYKKSVVILQKNKYPRQDCFMLQCSFDSKEYICKTCHAKLYTKKSYRNSVVSKTKTYENEDRRPKMGLRNYENEDPLRK